MVFKVGQDYRTNNLSFVPGGCTVIVEQVDGKLLEYDNIKYPQKYIAAAVTKPNVVNAWIKSS